MHFVLVDRTESGMVRTVGKEEEKEKGDGKVMKVVTWADRNRPSSRLQQYARLTRSKRPLYCKGAELGHLHQ